MTQEDAVIVRPAPVGRVALGIMHVARTIRNFLVNPPNAGSYDLTQLYDLCISSLFQIVYPRPESLERTRVAWGKLRRGEPRLLRAERRLRRARH